MRARNVARDRQAEAAAAFVLITRVVKPREWLEHLLAHRRRNARPWKATVGGARAARHWRAAETQPRVHPDGRFVAATPAIGSAKPPQRCAAGVLALPYTVSASTPTQGGGGKFELAAGARKRKLVFPRNFG